MTGTNYNRVPELVLGSRFAIKGSVGVFRSAAERPGVREQFRMDWECYLMRKTLLATAVIAASLGTGAFAAVELNTYADGEGYLDVQALTCAQLADTFQEDANYLTAWYSGWYNGLAKKHFANIPRSKEAEHETIVYCKAHPGEEKVIKVLGRIIDEYREKKGIDVHR